MTGCRESHGGFWVHAGGGTVVSCCTYHDEAPILTLVTGQMSLNLTVTGRQDVTAAEAGFARDLADRAATFAAECERLAAEHEDRARLALEAGGSAA
jgi:hypothetical protein